MRKLKGLSGLFDVLSRWGNLMEGWAEYMVTGKEEGGPGMHQHSVEPSQCCGPNLIETPVIACTLTQYIC